MDLTGLFKTGDTVFVKNDIWTKPPMERVVKTVTPKQVRFAEKSYPSFVNADRVEGQVFASPRAFYQYACTNTEAQITCLRMDVVAKEKELAALRAKRDGA